MRFPPFVGQNYIDFIILGLVIGLVFTGPVILRLLWKLLVKSAREL